MGQQVQEQAYQPPAALSSLAARLNIDASEMQNIVMNTLMKAKDGGSQVANEEFVTFLAIANEYNLNPLTKEIYAFANRGAIQPIVSIDGWLKIINGNSQFDGMEFEDSLDTNGNLSAITCRIYRKDRARPVEVTEYLSECAGTSAPWKKWPARMLRHKATIQAARYAFGLSGIVDPDEAERIESVVGTEKDITPVTGLVSTYSGADFDKNFPNWAKQVEDGKKTPKQILAFMEKKGVVLSESQVQSIKNIGEQHEAA